MLTVRLTHNSFRRHIDAPFYRTHPPKVTSLWTKILPKGADLTARFDDGSGVTMKVPPGLTAFLDSTKMYESLSDEDKEWVAHSSVEYAPSPCEFRSFSRSQKTCSPFCATLDQWIQDSKALGNGFGLVSDGLETPFDELPSNDENLVMRYPLVSVHSQLFVQTSVLSLVSFDSSGPTPSTARRPFKCMAS